jgi:hypothetical protein
MNLGYSYRVDHHSKEVDIAAEPRVKTADSCALGITADKHIFG